MALVIGAVGCGDGGPECPEPEGTPTCAAGIVVCDAAGDPVTWCVEDGRLFAEPYAFAAQPFCRDSEPQCSGDYTLRCLPCPDDRAALPSCIAAPGARVEIVACD